ncbi:hypothetical protein JCGZ_19800 [Jatropha curcas]|uniref:Pentatricopeptide repeat-containing protein n=1 Tax=Jatropha curcas TaxID=180498 RepID=A0A067K6J0_JATCU|nr:hypothetical protein JCGZ_19800 [Jatropha curcas]
MSEGPTITLVTEALELFLKIKNKGILPNVVTYNTLIRGLCMSSRWKEAFMLLNQMLRANVIPNLITFSTLVDGFCKEGKVSKAHGVVKLMMQRGLEPNVITYNSFMDGYCLHNQVDQAKNTFNLMVSKGCTPNVFTYNILIHCYWKRKRIDEAMLLFDEMPCKGLSPNHGLCKAKSPWAAHKFFKDMCAIGHSPNIVTYSILIDGFCKHSRLDIAFDLFYEMQKNLLKPHLIIYNTLIDDATTLELVVNDDVLVKKLLSCSKSSQGVKLN